MRLTLTLSKGNYRFLIKQIWKAKGYVRSTPVIKPWYLADKNIVDPNIPQPFEKTWKPPIEDAPQYRRSVTVDQHPDYHDDHVYEYQYRTHLMEGVEQACILTKTRPTYSLPEKIQENLENSTLYIPGQDELIQRYIMQANVWDPTKDKLPRRINKQLPGWRFKAEYGIPERRIKSILIQNLVRLCQKFGGQHPDLLLSRALVQQPYVSVSYTHGGEKPILIRGADECLVTSDRALEPFATPEESDETTAYDLPDIRPLSPTINLIKQRVYREGENITGFQPGFQFSHPHTLFKHGKVGVSADGANARMLMYCFAHCLAGAKAKYGAEVQTLPEPISMQCILTDGATFHFACFQLNTTNLESPSGVKNIVWFDNDNDMYQKILPKRAMLRNTKYEDYDPDVFKKVLAFYTHGADLNRAWPQSRVQTEMSSEIS